MNCLTQHSFGFFRIYFKQIRFGVDKLSLWMIPLPPFDHVDPVPAGAVPASSLGAGGRDEGATPPAKHHSQSPPPLGLHELLGDVPGRVRFVLGHHGVTLPVPENSQNL